MRAGKRLQEVYGHRVERNENDGRAAQLFPTNSLRWKVTGVNNLLLIVHRTRMSTAVKF